MRLRSTRPAQSGQGLSAASSLRRARPPSRPPRSGALSRPAAILSARVSRFRPSDEKQLAEIVAAAVANEETLEVVAGSSKREFGRPAQLPHTLDVNAFAGVRQY